MKKDFFKAVVAFFVMMLVIGLAGRCDFEEEVLCTMPDATYRYMKATILNADDYEIAKLYKGREAYWDEQAVWNGYGTAGY